MVEQFAVPERPTPMAALAALHVPVRSPDGMTSRHRVALAAGLGTAACAFSGLYPQFDGGALRGILGLSSLVFGPIVAWRALGATSAVRAAIATVGLAAGFGALSTVVPALVIDLHGAGFPLVAWPSQENDERVQRIAALWVLVGALVSVPLTIANLAEAFDHGKPWLAVARLAMFGALAIASAVTAWRAHGRLGALRAWIASVRAGSEASLHVRMPRETDHLEGIPVLSTGATASVVEWVATEEQASLYRDGAQRRVVALIAD